MTKSAFYQPGSAFRRQSHRILNRNSVGHPNPISIQGPAQRPSSAEFSGQWPEMGIYNLFTWSVNEL